MPRIPNEFLDCVVYLYPSEADAMDGKNAGGSGFVVGIPVPYIQNANAYLTCIVTNRHVVDNGSMTLRLNKIGGGIAPIDLDQMPWINHPNGDDVSVCLILLDATKYDVKLIGMERFITDDTLASLDVGIGDDVFLVGRVINREGKLRNIPSVRFGTIAQMPGEPIVDQSGFEQECYLVEARSIAGYSGSPVFIQFLPELPSYPTLPPNLSHLQQQRDSNRPDIPFKIGPYLLGINFANIFAEEKVFSGVTRKPYMADLYVKANIGMMGVIPTAKIRDILDSPDVMAVRDMYGKALVDTMSGNQPSFYAAVLNQIVTHAGLKVGVPADEAS